ncbi:MAG: DUF4249 domain-containing protein [Mucilaginibacter sp.]
MKNIINLKYHIASLLLLLAFASCRKVIDLKLGNHTGELVIEANFTYENGTQVVKISRNVPFTNTNTYPRVTGATVSMDNHHGRITQFTEDSAGVYTVKNLGGTLGRTYTMTFIIDGQTYTADSTMPANEVQLDSISSKNDIFGDKKNRKTITVYFKDIPNVANQYRFVMYVNKVQVKSVFAFDDEFIDGKYVNLDLQENDIDVFPGDTVNVEMQCLDRPIYTYWFTLAQQQMNNPGGAVAPANPPTNITPTTLGYFSAHTTQTRTLVVK